MANPVPRLLMILLVATLAAACSKKMVAPDDDPVVAADSLAPIIGVCLNGYLPNQPEHPLHVIRTRSEYESLQSLMRDSLGMCADTTLPTIDFTRSTLLGKHTMGSGCRLEVPVSRMSVVRNASTGTVLWTIVHIEHGRCEPIHYAMSWVIVPAISPDDSVAVRVVTEVVE